MSRPFGLIINVLSSFCQVKFLLIYEPNYDFRSFTLKWTGSDVRVGSRRIYNVKIDMTSYFRSCTLIELNPVLIRPRRHPFRSSFFLLPKWSESQKLKSQKRFLFRNPRSEKAGKQNRVKAHGIPKKFWPNFSSASENFHQKWRQIFSLIIFNDRTDHSANFVALQRVWLLIASIIDIWMTDH